MAVFAFLLIVYMANFSLPVSLLSSWVFHSDQQLTTKCFLQMDIPGGSVVKNSTYKCRRCRFDPWVEKNPGGGDGNPL